MGRRRKEGHTISEREMERDKRSKATELQRLQLVAEAAAETKSKKINIQLDLTVVRATPPTQPRRLGRKKLNKQTNIYLINCFIFFPDTLLRT